MWVYVQSTGRLLASDGSLLAIGYAGHEVGKNNPAMQEVHNIGPLPCGGYDICPPVDTETHGPYVLWLKPDPKNVTFGRSGFAIHGERVNGPSGSASDGCIILNREIRVRVWASGNHRLRVVSGLLNETSSDFHV
jgi:hypothetical protein